MNSFGSVVAVTPGPDGGPDRVGSQVRKSKNQSVTSPNVESLDCLCLRQRASSTRVGARVKILSHTYRYACASHIQPALAKLPPTTTATAATTTRTRTTTAQPPSLHLPHSPHHRHSHIYPWLRVALLGRGRQCGILPRVQIPPDSFLDCN